MTVRHTSKGKHMDYLKALLTACVVTLVLGIYESRKQKKNHTKNVDHFTARLDRSVLIAGILGVGLFTVLEIAAYLSDQYIPTLLTVLMFLFFGLPGMFLILGTVPGFWEIRVDGDDLTVVKLFFIKKHFKISQIERCARVDTLWEIWVYVKDRKRRAFIVDAEFDNYSTFMKRMDKEQIHIYRKKHAFSKEMP
jgi:hypothetical protein